MISWQILSFSSHIQHHSWGLDQSCWTVAGVLAACGYGWKPFSPQSPSAGVWGTVAGVELQHEGMCWAPSQEMPWALLLSTLGVPPSDYSCLTMRMVGGWGLRMMGLLGTFWSKPLTVPSQADRVLHTIHSSGFKQETSFVRGQVSKILKDMLLLGLVPCTQFPLGTAQHCGQK